MPSILAHRNADVMYLVAIAYSMSLVLLSMIMVSISLFPSAAHGFQGKLIKDHPSFLFSRQFQRHQQCKHIVERNNCRYHPLQQQQQLPSSSSSSSSSMILYATNNNNRKQLEDFVTGVESQATTASESWIVDATPFLSLDQSIAIQHCFEGRADIASFRVGGYYHNSNSDTDNDNDDESSQLQLHQQQRRYRYVFTNPDLGYDFDTANKEYCSILRIDNVQINNCNPWPNILISIGILLEDVGDIYIVGENTCHIFLVVNPTIVKTCIRLLPKELPGSGVTVTQLEYEEIKLIPNNGKVIEDMELKRLDKRAQK
mmetsp:Transcript_59500/g.66586  ORF Transcript_59500/g.66586 Transcript_59500/m.66586 type:complete len:315 (-) Transcript_59500:7-951(-)